LAQAIWAQILDHANKGINCKFPLLKHKAFYTMSLKIVLFSLLLTGSMGLKMTVAQGKDVHGPDVFLSSEAVKRLSARNPEWDEPFSLDDEKFLPKDFKFDNSTLCRKSMRDKLSSLRNERVMLLSMKEFKKKKFMDRLPASGAVLFVIDDPIVSTDETVRCDDKMKRALDDPRILSVASENSMCAHTKVSSIPIGMESKLLAGKRGHQTLTTFMQLKENPPPTKQRKYDVQSDAHLHIFKHPRSQYRDDRGDMVRGIQQSTVDDWYTDFVDMNSHFKNHVSQAKLSLCPEGNSMDTHRFYHNYALRNRCIVRKGYLAQLQSEFPGTIVVDSWDEVTPTNIQKWRKESDATYDPQLLTSDYWINKFLEPHGISPLVL